MKCIARRGMSSTTLGDVASEAGLSQGIVNLHFNSKDNLLTETLRYLADEYKAQFKKAYDKSGPGPADKLLALIELDLRPSICDRRKVAVWFAFWGEVQSRPTYRKICDERDQYYDETIERLAADIIAEGGYDDVTAESVCHRSELHDQRAVAVLPDQPAELRPAQGDGRVARLFVQAYSPNTFPSEIPMHIDISKERSKWQRIARDYADNYLQPHEVRSRTQRRRAACGDHEAQQEPGHRAWLHRDRCAESDTADSNCRWNARWRSGSNSVA